MRAGAAALAVFAVMSLIVTGDTAGKLLMQTGTAPFFVAWSRFALAAVILLPVSGLRRAELRSLLDRRVVARAALIAGGIAAILTALRTEPIADVFGAFFIGPVVAYVLSVLLLGERVTRTRSVALAVGFAGVLLVVRPGFDMTAGMGFALLAGGLHGGYLVMTRHLAGRFRARFLLISQLLVGAVLLAPAGMAAGMRAGIGAVDARLAALLALSALASAGGNYLLVRVNRTVPASRIAPLIYTQLIAATLAGIAVFGTWPDMWTLAGLTAILASGLASLPGMPRTEPRTGPPAVAQNSSMSGSTTMSNQLPPPGSGSSDGDGWEKRGDISS